MQKRGVQISQSNDILIQLNGPQVTCGPPPEAPEGGSRTFQNKPEGSTTYATEVFAIHIDQFIMIQQVEYSCARGSQFFLENTSATAYVPKLNNRCLWRRFKVFHALSCDQNQQSQKFLFKGPGHLTPACHPVTSPIALTCQKFPPRATWRKWTTSGPRWRGSRGCGARAARTSSTTPCSLSPTAASLSCCWSAQKMELMPMLMSGLFAFKVFLILNMTNCIVTRF